MNRKGKDGPMPRKAEQTRTTPQASVLDELLAGLDPATAARLQAEVDALKRHIADLGAAAAEAGQGGLAGTRAGVEAFARDRPGQALLAAGGLGLLAGLLLARR